MNGILAGIGILILAKSRAEPSQGDGRRGFLAQRFTGKRGYLLTNTATIRSCNRSVHFVIPSRPSQAIINSSFVVNCWRWWWWLLLWGAFKRRYTAYYAIPSQTSKWNSFPLRTYTAYLGQHHHQHYHHQQQKNKQEELFELIVRMNGWYVDKRRII